MNKRVLFVAASVACASAPPRPAPEPVRAAAPAPPATPIDPNAPQPMPVGEFKQLVHSIDISPTGDQGKIAIIKTAAADNWFIVGEVAMLIDHVTYRQSKLDLIPILNPRITNRSEAWRLIDKFTYREDKAIVQQQLASHSPAPEGEGSAIANDIATSCKEDRMKFCSSVEPGGGRIQACYEAHKSELSEPCQKARAAARAAENATK